MILKDFKNTIPLVSKLYFKDSFAQEAKGFDSVHVSEDGTTLWLGETKFYKDSTKQGVKKGGIDELVKDLNSHFVKDYLQEQFVIIRRGLDTQYQVVVPEDGLFAFFFSEKPECPKRSNLFLTPFVSHKLLLKEHSAV